MAVRLLDRAVLPLIKKCQFIIHLILLYCLGVCQPWKGLFAWFFVEIFTNCEKKTVFLPEKGSGAGRRCPANKKGYPRGGIPETLKMERPAVRTFARGPSR
jgi:hypothetical protein